MAILFTKALYRKTTHSFFDTDVNNFEGTFLYKFTFYMNYGDSAEDKALIFLRGKLRMIRKTGGNEDKDTGRKFQEMAGYRGRDKMAALPEMKE